MDEHMFSFLNCSVESIYMLFWSGVEAILNRVFFKQFIRENINSIGNGEVLGCIQVTGLILSWCLSLTRLHLFPVIQDIYVIPLFQNELGPK